MTTTLKLGIDEAGRGPVIGPLVMAGCLINEKTERKLKRLGVKDSKQLTKEKREFLDGKIREEAEVFEIMITYPEEIDGNNHRGTKLNETEAFVFSKIINKINRGFREIKVIVDCPSPSVEKWKETLKNQINHISNLDIVCEHKADENYVAVSAASILAKNIREKEMNLLKEKYGEVGSGYCHDPITIRFIEENLKKYNKEGIFRKSWSTWKIAMDKISQKKLGDF